MIGPRFENRSEAPAHAADNEGVRQAPGRRSISSQSTAAGPCRRRRRVAIAIAALGILWACRPLVASSGERGPVSGDSGQVLRLAPASGALDAPTSRFPDAAPRHHVMGELTCAECHLCTADEGEGSDPGDSGGLPPGPTSASNPALLRESDPVRLCLSCHDGHPGIPDVVGADVNGLADRSAGFFQPPDVLSRDGHTLGHGPAGGNRDGSSHADRVICIDCHNPHGDGFARNLRRLGDAGTTPPLGLFVDPAARGLSRYESSRISFGTLDSDSLREVSSLCTRCHEALSDVPRGDGNCLRHPTYDSEPVVNTSLSSNPNAVKAESISSRKPETMLFPSKTT